MVTLFSLLVKVGWVPDNVFWVHICKNILQLGWYIWEICFQAMTSLKLEEVLYQLFYESLSWENLQVTQCNCSPALHVKIVG